MSVFHTESWLFDIHCNYIGEGTNAFGVENGKGRRRQEEKLKLGVASNPLYETDNNFYDSRLVQHSDQHSHLKLLPMLRPWLVRCAANGWAVECHVMSVISRESSSYWSLH